MKSHHFLSFPVFFLFPFLIFLIHFACSETLSVSFNVFQEDGKKWSGELVYLDVIDVKGSIRKQEVQDRENGIGKDEVQDRENGIGKNEEMKRKEIEEKNEVKRKEKDADDLFYVIGMEMKKPLEMVVQGFLRFEPRNSTFFNDLKASNGISLQSTGSFERISQSDDREGFRLEIHSLLTFRDQLKVTYDLKCERRQICPRILLNHSLATYPHGLVTFQSEAIETCHGSKDESSSGRNDESSSGRNDESSSGRNDQPFIPSDVVINILLQSHLYPLLNTQLDQIFVFSNSSTGWESMNATNPAADINVRADWDDTFHLKTASFFGKMFNLPSFDVEYNKNDGYSLLMRTKKFRLSPTHDEL